MLGGRTRIYLFFFFFTFFTTLHSQEAQSSWWLWTRLGGIGDAAKVPVKPSPKPKTGAEATSQDRQSNASSGHASKDSNSDSSPIAASKDRGPSSSPIYELRARQRKVLAVDATSQHTLMEALIAEQNAADVWLLTDTGARLLRNGEFIVREKGFEDLIGFLKTASVVIPELKVKLVRSDGFIGRVLSKKQNGTNVLMAELYTGVFVEVSAGYVDLLTWILQQPLRAADVRVVTLLHPTDVDVLRKIDNAVGDAHLPSGARSTDEIIQTVKRQKEKTIFIIGHVEGDKFVIRDPSGKIEKKISISDLENAAKDVDTSLFLLGCGAGLCSSSSGFIGEVNAFDVTEGLRRTVQQQSFGEALSVLAGYSGDTLVRPSLEDSVRASISAERLASTKYNKAPVYFMVTRVSTISEERSEELASRIIPSVSTRIQNTYLFGLLVLVISAPFIRRQWRGIRGITPRFGHRPLARILIGVVRALAVLSLMPFAAAVSAFVVLFPWWVTVVNLYSHEHVVPTLIAAIFGWKLWKIKNPEYKVHWMLGFWVIVFFCSLVPQVTSFALSLPSVIDSVLPPKAHIGQQSNFEDQSGYVIVATAVTALLFSFVLFTLIRRLKRDPSVLPIWLILAPLRFVEFFVRRFVVQANGAGRG